VAPTVVVSKVNFDSDRTGQMSAGWTGGVTAQGTARWTVEVDPAAPRQRHVLKQSGKAMFCWCVKDTPALADGAVEVKFKPVAGEQDQAGGLVWRWKDGNNYYVARANALEGNVSLYHTTNGGRRTIVYEDAPVARDVWQTLRVEFNADAIRVLLDGKLYIDTLDSHISGAGRVGVWTKADSVTLFDDFIIEAPAT